MQFTWDYFYYYLKKESKDLVFFSAKSKNGTISINISMTDGHNSASFIALGNAESKIEGSYLKEVRGIIRDIYQRYLDYTDMAEIKFQKFSKFLKWCLGEPTPSFEDSTVYSGNDLAEEFIFGSRVIKMIDMGESEN